MADKSEKNTVRSQIAKVQSSYGFNNAIFDKITHMRSLIKNDYIYEKYWLGQTAEERKVLSTISISREHPQSYFVYGSSQDDLYKFLTYYCIMSDRGYTEWDIQDFLDNLNTPRGAYLGINDILVFYQHRFNIFLGAGEAYTFSRLLRYITSRNRAGEPTIILSEVMDNKFIEAGEVELINLVELFKRTTVTNNLTKVVVDQYEAKKANKVVNPIEVAPNTEIERAVKQQTSDIMARKMARQAKKR